MSFADEQDLIRAFGALVGHFPQEALSPGAGHLLIIANELHLPEGSVSGGDGSADLLAVDDLGEVWLIEAKLHRNPQSNPWYLFGSQLSTYGGALNRAGLVGIHQHLQDYAFGRRPTLAPPDALAGPWQEARSLTDMLAPWLANLGRGEQEAEQLRHTIDRRIRSGHFILAALVDHDDGSLAAWGRQFAADFHTAVIVLNRGGLAVPFRTEWRPFQETDEPSALLPPFGRIPQSFSVRPHTIPMVLNEAALRLWFEVVEPRLVAILGLLGNARCDGNSTSFGYCLPSSSGPPFFLRVGRGDERTHRGHATGTPGAHALRVDVGFKWGCSEILRMGPDQSKQRQEAIDSIYRLCHGLVFRAGYRLKATDHRGSRENFNREFQRAMSARTLLVERGGLRGGVPDFGTNANAFDEEVRALTTFFDELEKELASTRPLPPVLKPKRRGDYSEGMLEDCRPSIDLDPGLRRGDVP